MRERSQPGSQDAASTSRVSWRLATPELEEQDAKLRKEVWLTAGWSPRLSSLAEQGSLPWNLPRPCLCAGQVRTDSRTRLSPRRRAERRADPEGCVGWGSKLGASILLFPVEKRLYPTSWLRSLCCPRAPPGTCPARRTTLRPLHPSPRPTFHLPEARTPPPSKPVYARWSEGGIFADLALTEGPSAPRRSRGPESWPPRFLSPLGVAMEPTAVRP